jgi:nicotinate-nucleotide pyrophosphorylase (carboxylating)
VTPAPPIEALARAVEAALVEDLGSGGDITTNAIVPAGTPIMAEIRSREAGRIAGTDVLALTLSRFPDPATVTILAPDGIDVPAGAIIARLAGSARTVLGAERTMLNILGRLSGIATATAAVVRRIGGTDAIVKDTRKTTPGLRQLERYAVAVGGGVNHRFGLYDAVLIKDNHIGIAGSITAAVERTRAALGAATPLQVEVDTLKQLEEALRCNVNAVLLDNMTSAQLRRAVMLANGRCHTEASGGITLANVREVAASGVDSVSLGWLTHSARALDLGLDISAADG